MDSGTRFTTAHTVQGVAGGIPLLSVPSGLHRIPHTQQKEGKPAAHCHQSHLPPAVTTVMPLLLSAPGAEGWRWLQVVVVQRSLWPPGLLPGVISSDLSIKEARKGEQPFISSCLTSSSGELYLPSECGQTVSSQQGGAFPFHTPQRAAWANFSLVG